jgi:hypothetical protein
MKPNNGILTLLFCLGATGPLVARADWRQDWVVEAGFALAIDSDGFELPSAIAFVPAPGPGPKDPLYFVTELRGTIKVVTNDRTVHTFADALGGFEPEAELPAGEGQAGLAGICLSPKQGYVFATFAYHDETGTLRNNIARFQSLPGSFSLNPSDRVDFTDVFAAYDTGLAHHIGGCQTSLDHLYVGVGDGWQPKKAQDLDAMRGKILRMTLNGDPIAENPFHVDGDRARARNYVWALGLRNPFSLFVDGDRVIGADNGIAVDRFLEFREGENYLWDGDHRSVATNAIVVFAPSIGPVQLARFDRSNTAGFRSELDGAFFVAASAHAAGDKAPGVVQVDYDPDTLRVRSTPRYLVRYAREHPQAVAALGFGPDGLYFAPLYPGDASSGSIIKITYDPELASGRTLVQHERPADLLAKNGCVGCHQIFGKWGHAGGGAHKINETTLRKLHDRLNSKAYERWIAELDALNREPQASLRAQRSEVLNASGWDRVQHWLEFRIQDPLFDSLHSQMPRGGVSAPEAELIAEYFVATARPKTGFEKIKALMSGRFAFRHLALALIIGGVGGAALTPLLSSRIRKRREKQSH